MLSYFCLPAGLDSRSRVAKALDACTIASASENGATSYAKAQ